MFETKERKERVILVGVSVSDYDDVSSSLDELEDLAKTAGAVCVGRLIQKREQIHPTSYLGKGKIMELKDLLWETEADGIICDDELSPAQISNLKAELDTKIMDRTLLILDIFAARASTSEGKIQVELAQLKYRQSRLTGLGTSLSRLGGGIGTRGPGEKKLEMDRRLIKSRISRLNQELKEVKRHREVTREHRNRENIPVAAIVGYTNAGKSTLLNYLTDAGILAEDKLFATLDPTTRVKKLPGGQKILLRELQALDKPVITAFNKIDTARCEYVPRDFQADRTVCISAKTGEGTEELLSAVEDILREQKIEVEKLYLYNEAGKIQIIRQYGELSKEEYREEGIYVKAYVPAFIYGRIC